MEKSLTPPKLILKLKFEPRATHLASPEVRWRKPSLTRFSRRSRRTFRAPIAMEWRTASERTRKAQVTPWESIWTTSICSLRERGRALDLVLTSRMTSLARALTVLSCATLPRMPSPSQLIALDLPSSNLLPPRLMRSRTRLIRISTQYVNSLVQPKLERTKRHTLTNFGT